MGKFVKNQAKPLVSFKLPQLCLRYVVPLQKLTNNKEINNNK